MNDLFSCNCLTNTRQVFTEWEQDYIEKFGRKTFIIGHKLANCYLFELPRLERLAKDTYAARKAGRVRDAQIKPRRGSADMSTWASVVSIALHESDWEAQLGKLFSETESDASGLSIMLACTNEVDVAYDSLMRQMFHEIAEHVGLPLSEITHSGLTVIVAAPGTVTPYHNDRGLNFLLQIKGGKDVYLYDRGDPFVLSRVAIDNSQLENGRNACFWRELEELGTIYHLEPGLAVHHPPLVPHWVKNGNNVSVSISFHFSTRRLDDLSLAHEVNWSHHRFGLKWTPTAGPLQRALRTSHGKSTR